MYLKVYKDYETSERAGAGGMFQIISVEDLEENDLTNQVDVGIHFHDNENLKNYLADIFNVPADEIDLETE